VRVDGSASVYSRLVWWVGVVAWVVGWLAEVNTPGHPRWDFWVVVVPGRVACLWCGFWLSVWGVIRWVGRLFVGWLVVGGARRWGGLCSLRFVWA